MDFTLKKYAELLDALDECRIVLRHDVDLRPDRSLEMARLEAAKGWKAVYYFRAVPQSWDADIIRQIAAMGHEIGYHYESLTTCNGDVDAAWEDFKANLAKLRELVRDVSTPETPSSAGDVSTSETPSSAGDSVHSVCMHGSPRSKWDSKDIWNKYDYRSVGVDFEPYLDTDWEQTFYLTDTGRRWDGWKVSVRDKIPLWQDKWAAEGLIFHSTNDIIRAAKRLASQQGVQQGSQQGSQLGAQQGSQQGAPILPRCIMITTHPQRWMPFSFAWIREFLLQNFKNIVKMLLIKYSNNSIKYSNKSSK